MPEQCQTSSRSHALFWCVVKRVERIGSNIRVCQTGPRENLLQQESDEQTQLHREMRRSNMPASIPDELKFAASFIWLERKT